MPSAASPPGPFAFLSRRRFLRIGLGGAALLGAGVGGLASLRGCAPSAGGLRILSAHEYRTLSHLARACFPAGGPFAQGADDLDLARAFDGFLADEPKANQGDLRTALQLVEFGPLIFDRRATTFSNLPVEEQLAHWQTWALSDSLLRRKVAVAFRRFLAMVFFGQPALWAHIGYPGPKAMEQQKH